MRNINTTILPAFQKQIKFIVIPDSLFFKTQKSSHSKSDFQSCCCPVCEANIFTYEALPKLWFFWKSLYLLKVKSGIFNRESVIFLCGNLHMVAS